MLKVGLVGLVAAAGLSLAAPAVAQDAPINGVTYLYGPEAKCPTDQQGNEITVCVRRPASEQYRIPKDLREGSIKPQYESFANKQRALDDVGGSGIGSCTTAGAGGQTNCSTKEFLAYRAERKARAAAKRAEAAAIAK